MAYLGKVGGPKVSQILKRTRKDFQEGTINYDVWEQGIFIGNRIGGIYALMEAYDFAIEKAKEKEARNEVIPIIQFGNQSLYFEISSLSGCSIFRILIEYRPIGNEMELLGEDYQKEIRDHFPAKDGSDRCVVRDDAWG